MYVQLLLQISTSKASSPYLTPNLVDVLITHRVFLVTSNTPLSDGRTSLRIDRRSRYAKGRNSRVFMTTQRRRSGSD